MVFYNGGVFMKAVCISCFNSYEHRVKHFEQYLSNHGFEVTYITSDFDHIRKEKYSIIRSNVIQISTLPYYSNLSFQRLRSHYDFSQKAIDEVARIKPDVLYIMVPPNYLVKLAALYKRKYGVVLIYDIFDLWPESFPSSTMKKLLAVPLKYWSGLRNNYLQSADVIVTECDLFKKTLDVVGGMTNIESLYLTKPQSKFLSKFDQDSNSIGICYLGSINNIIDGVSIRKLLSSINQLKPVVLHIIGDGEKREQFLDELRAADIDFVFYGMIFDEGKKQAIFDQCAFGINMMKSSVCVGLSLKSIDYFQAGLPLLNNIKADTADIIEFYQVGYNITDTNHEEIAQTIAHLDRNDSLSMRCRTRDVFNNFFSFEAFYKKLDTVMQKVITQCNSK